jgi:hypothetical protein
VSDELWERVQGRLAWTRKIYGQQKRNGLLNRSASGPYLFSGIVKCNANFAGSSACQRTLLRFKARRILAMLRKSPRASTTFSSGNITDFCLGE